MSVKLPWWPGADPGADDDSKPGGEVAPMPKQDWSDAVPDVAGETFREFYARKWGVPWPRHGEQVAAPISMLRQIAEASADWMDALAKRERQ